MDQFNHLHIAKVMENLKKKNVFHKNLQKIYYHFDCFGGALVLKIIL